MITTILSIYLLIGITLAIAAAFASKKINFTNALHSITSILAILLLAIFWPLPILLYRGRVK